MRRPTRSAEVAEAVDRPRGRVRPSQRARWRALSLIALHVAMVAHFVHWKIARTTLTPLEPSEIMQTFSQGLVNAGAILFAIATLSTLIFGRFFCGWGCHIVALQDLCSWLLGKLGIRPRPFRSRLLVFAPLLAAIFMFVLPTLTQLAAGGNLPEYRSHLYTDDFWARFPSWPVALLTLGVCGFGIVYLLGNKAFCSYACPYGGVFGLVEPLAPIRVRVTDACDGCGHCTATCTSNVRVHEEVRLHRMVIDPGCMRCTDCVSVCPKHALYIGVGRPAAWKPPARAEPRPLPASYSWPEELALALCFLLSVAILRKLYDVVPFLLALALAAISAHLLLTAWRCGRRPRVSYGRWLLKSEGVMTGNGYSVMILSVLWLLFLVHSGWIQYLTMSGAGPLDRAIVRHQQAEPEGAAQSRASLQQSLAKLRQADRWGLLPVGNLLVGLGNGSASLGDDAASEAYFRRAVAVSPEHAYAHLALARYAELRGDRSGQISKLHDALAADPEQFGAHEALVRALSAMGRNDEAKTRLEALLALRPHAAGIRLTYAMLLANMSDFEGAVEHVEWVLREEPTNAVALFDLALLYANRQRFGEASAVCERLLAVHGEDATATGMCERVAESFAQQRAREGS